MGKKKLTKKEKQTLYIIGVIIIIFFFLWGETNPTYGCKKIKEYRSITNERYKVCEYTCKNSDGTVEKVKNWPAYHESCPISPIR